jgi:hypothetical protein
MADRISTHAVAHGVDPGTVHALAPVVAHHAAVLGAHIAPHIATVSHMATLVHADGGDDEDVAAVGSAGDGRSAGTPAHRRALQECAVCGARAATDARVCQRGHRL